MNKTCLSLCLVVAGLSLATSEAITFKTTLSGPAEDPPNASPGTGSVVVVWDEAAKTMAIDANFSGLLGATTAAHIHGATALPNQGTAGVMTQTPSFTLFPLGVQSGTFSNTYDLTDAATYRAAFLTSVGGTPEAAAAALLQALLDEKAYFNIHSSVFGGGEIRGFLRQVPDGGATAAMLGMGFLMLAGWRRLAVGS